LGFSGKQIGACLQYLLDQVLEEAIPNDRDILLSAAQRYFTSEDRQ
jgi:hypothetical protein